MPSGAPELVSVVVPMVVADGWGRSAVYETIKGASVLTLPFTSNTEGGLDKADFSIMGERHGGRLNAGEDNESEMVVGTELDVDGSTDSSGRPIEYLVNGS